MSRGRTPYTREMYDAICDAYEEAPGNHSVASAKSGFSRKACRRAWELGWTGIEWARPIRVVFEERATIARARIQEAERLAREAQQKEANEAAVRLQEARAERVMAREQAKQTALETLTQEANLVRMARVNGLGLMNLVAACIKGGMQLRQRVEEWLSNAWKEGAKPEPKEIAALFRAFTGMVREANEAGKIALEMERLRLGDPARQMDEAQPGEMTLEEAIREIEDAQRVLYRAVETGAVPAEALTVKPGEN